MSSSEHAVEAGVMQRPTDSNEASINTVSGVDAPATVHMSTASMWGHAHVTICVRKSLVFEMIFTNDHKA